jgi:phage/plasmid-associated DNA primase
MRNREATKFVAVLLVIVLLSVILAGCGTINIEGDPYSAGQKARTEFDQAADKAGDFVAGFCSTAPLPVAALGLVVVLRQTKKD